MRKPIPALFILLFLAIQIIGVPNTLAIGALCELPEYLLSGTVKVGTTGVPAIITVCSVSNNCTETETETDDPGYFEISLPEAIYALKASYDGKEMWYSKKPTQVASTKITLTKSTRKNFTFGSGDSPTIDAVTPIGDTIARGQQIIITGQNFGSTKSYVLFGDYYTNSSIYISKWTDTEIIIKIPSCAPLTMLRVFCPLTGTSGEYCIAQPIPQ